jgi:uridine phosphorylase
MNGALEPFYEMKVLKNNIRRPADLDANVNEQLLKICSEIGLPSQIGKTMCCDDFYEGQGRLDGAICNYTPEEKLAFL